MYLSLSLFFSLFPTPCRVCSLTILSLPERFKWLTCNTFSSALSVNIFLSVDRSRCQVLLSSDRFYRKVKQPAKGKETFRSPHPSVGAISTIPMAQVIRIKWAQDKCIHLFNRNFDPRSMIIAFSYQLMGRWFKWIEILQPTWPQKNLPIQEVYMIHRLH